MKPGGLVVVVGQESEQWEQHWFGRSLPEALVVIISPRQRRPLMLLLLSGNITVATVP